MEMCFGKISDKLHYLHGSIKPLTDLHHCRWWAARDGVTGYHANLATSIYRIAQNKWNILFSFSILHVSHTHGKLP